MRNKINLYGMIEYNKIWYVIIGDIEKENMTLFLSEKGLFFAGYDDCLINWGGCFRKNISCTIICA